MSRDTDAPQTFPGRLALQQRVLPRYRVAFFEKLHAACDGGLLLFAGQPRPEESIPDAGELMGLALTRAQNIHLWAGRALLQPGLLNWLEAGDPTALILEANPRYLSNRAALRWMQRRGRPVLGWGLGAPPLTGLLSPLRDALRRRYLRSFDALIAYSSQGAEEYRRLGFPAERIFVALNAVAPPPTAYHDRSPHTGPLRILFVGRLQARKRVDLLIRACAALETPIALTIVGDGPARADLEALAADLLPGTHFAGARHGAEAQPFFEAADLFALPGTGGLAVQQAMVYGLPVLAAEGDGTMADLVGPENGWRLPPGDLEALISALQNAAAGRDRLQRMGRASYELVQRKSNIEAMTDTFLRALAAVM